MYSVRYVITENVFEPITSEDIEEMRHAAMVHEKGSSRLPLSETRQRRGYVFSTCRACNHAKRAEIEDSVMRESYEKVAKRYGLSKSGLVRHMQNHYVLPEDPK